MYYPEEMKARVSPVQWSKPNSILAPTQDSNPGCRIQNHKRWPLHYHCMEWTGIAFKQCSEPPSWQNWHTHLPLGGASPMPTQGCDSSRSYEEVRGLDFTPPNNYDSMRSVTAPTIISSMPSQPIHVTHSIVFFHQRSSDTMIWESGLTHSSSRKKKTVC